MALSIDDLLNSLQNPHKPDKADLKNNKENWARIKRKDAFEELGITGSELNEFLKDWIENNPYSTIA